LKQQDHFEGHNRHGRRANCQHKRKLYRHGNHNLGRMKAQTGGRIKLEIGMMHPVQTPKARHSVKDDMLNISREIQ